MNFLRTRLENHWVNSGILKLAFTNCKQRIYRFKINGIKQSLQSG